MQEASERQDRMDDKERLGVINTIKRIAREVTKGRKWGAGFHSSQKGDKGYRRHPKHKKREERS